MKAFENNEKVEQVLTLLAKTITDVGLNDTIEILERGKIEKLELNDINLVVESVCKAFNLPPSTLFSTSKKYPRKYAFAIWAYFSGYYLNYTPKDLSKFTNKSLETIYKAQGFIRNYPKTSDNTFDNKIIEKIKLCENNLKELLNKK
jgi:hypothetical protein